MSRLATVLLFLVSPVLADDNWPSFRGPHGDGTSPARGLPTKFGETENVVWKTPIPGKAWSSPVIWGKQIWLTNAPPDGKELSAVCVDKDSGKVLHDIKVFDNPKPAFCIAYNSYASSTPVVEEGRVYVHFGSAGTACLDTATGKILWERRDLLCDHFRGPGSSPIVWQGKLYLTFDGADQQYLAALDTKTGKTVWKKDRNIKYHTTNGDNKKAYSTPHVIDVKGKPQLISPAADATTSYDPETGDELWRVYHLRCMNTAVRPLYAHDRVYITTGYTNSVLALRPDGAGDVTKTHIDWSATRGAPSRPSPLLMGDLMFLVSDAGIATCLDAKTGKQLADQRLTGKFSASPVLADGKMYFCSEEGNVYVVKAERDLPILATNKLAEGFMASPAISGKALFLRSRTHLYRIELQ